MPMTDTLDVCFVQSPQQMCRVAATTPTRVIGHICQDDPRLLCVLRHGHGPPKSIIEAGQLCTIALTVRPGALGKLPRDRLGNGLPAIGVNPGRDNNGHTIRGGVRGREPRENRDVDEGRLPTGFGQS